MVACVHPPFPLSSFFARRDIRKFLDGIYVSQKTHIVNE